MGENYTVLLNKVQDIYKKKFDEFALAKISCYTCPYGGWNSSLQM